MSRGDGGNDVTASALNDCLMEVFRHHGGVGQVVSKVFSF